MTNEDTIKIIKRLLSESSDKELDKRKLGRGKKGTALEEIRAGLEQIITLSDEYSGSVRDHQFNKDTVSRLANKSWKSDQLKKQQTSLKRTSTEIANSITILDRLIASISDQRFDAMKNGEEVDYSSTMGLQARRKDLLNAKKIVMELKDTIEWAKDIKKRDEMAEASRQESIKRILKKEVLDIVHGYSALELVARFASLPRYWDEPRHNLEHLKTHGSEMHIAALKNKRSDFISDLMNEIEYNFTRPIESGLRDPLPVTTENVIEMMEKEFRGYEAIKKGKDYLDYVELYQSAKSVQSAIQTEDSEFVFCEENFKK